MKTYQVRIEEHNIDTVEIRAKSAKHAEELARNLYETGAILLETYNAEVEFTAIREVSL